jgi:hypothetical protein
MNIDKDFTFQTIKLAPDYEGEVIATLISSNRNLGDRRSVLYLHGYNDYFHTHVAEKFNENNFDFYALDLGNTADPSKNQHPNYCKDIYFEEISIAISKINTISKTLFTCLGILRRINSK